jgi:hypothetical protein
MEGDIREEMECTPELPSVARKSVAAYLPLVCPACTTSIRAGGRDAVYRCEDCRRSWRLEDSELVPGSEQVALGQGRLLPFWCVSGAATPLDAEADPEQRFFVPAFSPCPPSLLRRLSVSMSSRNPEYELGGTVDSEWMPVSIAAEEAVRVAMAIIPELGDEALAAFADSLEAKPMQATLLWVPFRSLKGFLTDPISEISISEVVCEAR